MGDDFARLREIFTWRSTGRYLQQRQRAHRRRKPPRQPRLRPSSPAAYSHKCSPHPPPRFSSPARSRASLLRFKPSRLRRAAARPEHTPLSDGAPNATGERARPLPTDFARPPSLISTVAARDPPLGARPWVPHLVHRRRLTPATPLDGGPATATHNTHKEEKP